MAQDENISYATGRRKTSSARVFIRPGSGQISVNGKELDAYFGRPVARILVRQPLVATETEGALDIKATVAGGGPSGQAQAIRHGLARALVKMERKRLGLPEKRIPEVEDAGEGTSEKYRPALRTAGYLTRDSRKVERKKVGLHKARKAPQYSKR